MKKTCIMLAASRDLIFASANIIFMFNIFCNKNYFDIVLYYDFIYPSDKKILECINNVILLQFQPPANFNTQIIQGNERFGNLDLRHKYNTIKFAKYEIFNLLHKYEKVIWLDADILIQSDIMGILEYLPCAITSDAPWKVGINFFEPLPEYDMEKEGVCTAVFMVSDKMAGFSEMAQWCYDKSVQYASYLNQNADQGIINILLQEFGVDYRLMPLEEYQCMPWKEEAQNARIVHFGTEENKIWNNKMYYEQFPQWGLTHAKWLKAGGSDYAKKE